MFILVLNMYIMIPFSLLHVDVYEGVHRGVKGFYVDYILF